MPVRVGGGGNIQIHGGGAIMPVVTRVTVVVTVMGVGAREGVVDGMAGRLHHVVTLHGKVANLSPLELGSVVGMGLNLTDQHLLDLGLEAIGEEEHMVLLRAVRDEGDEALEAVRIRFD